MIGSSSGLERMFFVGRTVASLRVKAAKVGVLSKLQIVQIRKSISYAESSWRGTTNPSLPPYLMNDDCH